RLYAPQRRLSQKCAGAGHGPVGTGRQSALIPLSHPQPAEGNSLRRAAVFLTASFPSAPPPGRGFLMPSRSFPLKTRYFLCFFRRTAGVFHAAPPFFYKMFMKNY